MALRFLSNRCLSKYSIMSISLGYGHRNVTAGTTARLDVCRHHATTPVVDTPVAFTSCCITTRFPLFNDSNVLSVGHQSWQCSTKRLKHRSTKINKTREPTAAAGENEEDGDDDDDNDEADEDDNDFPSVHFKEDANLPLNYKELKVHLKSPRLDAIVSSGIGIARNQVDDIFYGSRLKLNGERVLKKSKQMKVGDYVDLVVSGEAEAMKVKRVRIVKISEGRTNGEKLKIFLRAWRSPISVT